LVYGFDFETGWGRYVDMKNLYIMGAGGLGRELFDWLQDSPECGREWRLAGFLDDASRETLQPLPAPFFGSLEGATFEGDCLVALAIANPAAKQSMDGRLANFGLPLITFVHPTCQLRRNVCVGEGSLILANSILTCDIKVGRCALINLNVSIGHDVQIGDYSTLFSRIDLAGGVRLGDRVQVGSGAVIIPGRSVGSDAKVGAGSVVVSDVKPGRTVFGNPAKRL